MPEHDFSITVPSEVPLASVRQRRNAEVARLIGEFFANTYPAGDEAVLDGIGDLDAPFIEFWDSQEAEHIASCLQRPVHGDCATCDALRELHPGPIDGVCQPLRQRVLGPGASDGDPFGRITLYLFILRPSRAV